MEEVQIPILRGYAGTGRKPYQYQPFIRCVWAKCFFKISTDTELIRRLKTDSTLRLLCGFEKVPGKSTFSRNFGALSKTTIMKETLDKLVLKAHAGQVVYHVSRDSTAIEAQKKEKKSRVDDPRREKSGLQSQKPRLRDKCVKPRKNH
ncbi:MAG: transposase [Treponema sp.]|jgi:transposase|nr:transposase [Treponema sp.]